MDDHYFSADPAVAVQAGAGQRSVWGHELDLVSGSSGVFAQGRVDIGTAVLFRETPPPRAGRVLDLGCGYGVIGLAIARGRVGHRHWGRRQRARSAAGQRERREPGPGRSVHRLDAGGVAADSTYDEIWSNPPIRIGKAGAPRAAADLAAPVWRRVAAR